MSLPSVSHSERVYSAPGLLATGRSVPFLLNLSIYLQGHPGGYRQRSPI